MPTLHFLNVGDGDCIIIEHLSGRLTMFDVCCGNLADEQVFESRLAQILFDAVPPSTNFKMRDCPTRPQDYLKAMGRTEIWRFILSHPDMDHMDGFDALVKEFAVRNFWDSGARKRKPEFSMYSPYKEADWDRYAQVRDGKIPEVRTLVVRAGETLKYANSDDGNGGGDGLTILAPTEALVEEANRTEDFNDCSYVILYRTANRKIILAGDSHDKTWEYILANRRADVADCDLLIAPHHGRHSDRCWDFLDVLKPKLTLFGCADSEHLAYAAWANRDLTKITNNQAGNVVADVTETGLIAIYVENQAFAQSCDVDLSKRNEMGYVFLGYI